MSIITDFLKGYIAYQKSDIYESEANRYDWFTALLVFTVLLLFACLAGIAEHLLMP